MPPGYIIKKSAKKSLNDKWPAAIAIGIIIFAVLCVHIIIMELIAMLFGRLGETTAALLSLAIVIVLGQFFAVPVLYGALRWFWYTSSGADVPVSEMFCYFSRGREYAKAISLGFRIFTRILGILLLCFLPSIIVSLASKPITYQVFNFKMPYWASSMWALGNVLNFFGGVLSFILLLRYIAAPILMINDNSVSPQEALHLSVIITKSVNGQTFSFIIGFVGWFFLSFLVLPLIYTIPYFLCSYAIYSRNLINNYNNMVKEQNNKHIYTTSSQSEF